MKLKVLFVVSMVMVGLLSGQSRAVANQVYDFAQTTGNVITVPDPQVLNRLSQATWSFWINERQYWAQSGDAAIISRAGGDKKKQFAIALTAPGKLVVTVYVDKDYASWTSAADEFYDNEWYHIMVVFDGKQAVPEERLSVYQNGLPVARGTWSGTVRMPPVLNPISGQDLAIGSHRLRDALIDEVAIWGGFAATSGQAKGLYFLGMGADLSVTQFGQPHHWWRADGDVLPTVTDHGSRQTHGKATGGITLGTADLGTRVKRSGTFTVSSFRDEGGVITIHTEQDLCVHEQSSCGSTLIANFKLCEMVDCKARHHQWSATLRSANEIFVTEYVCHRDSVCHIPMYVEVVPYARQIVPPAPQEVVFDWEVVDIPLIGDTTFGGATRHKDKRECVEDVMQSWAGIERRMQHQSAMHVATGLRVLWSEFDHYQGIERMPERNGKVTPTFAFTAQDPGRLFLGEMVSKAPGYQFAQLTMNQKIGSNRLQAGDHEWDTDPSPVDILVGSQYFEIPVDNTHLGGMQAAGSDWLFVATDDPHSVDFLPYGGALIFNTASLTNPWPAYREEIDYTFGNVYRYYNWPYKFVPGSNGGELPEPTTVGAVAVTKLDSGYFLVDLQSHEWHAFFLSNTTDLATTDQWLFIGQRYFDMSTEGLDASVYQGVNMVTQCDGTLFLIGTGNTLDGGFQLNDWDGDDKAVLHRLGGSVKVWRHKAEGKLYSTIDPQDPMNRPGFVPGSDGNGHIGPSNAFVHLDQELGHTPDAIHFHLRNGEFRAGATFFVNGSNDLMAYAVERATTDSRVRIEEFVNRNSGGLWGHACSVLTNAWLALYERADCTTSHNDSVLYVDYNFLAARDIDDLDDFNDFNDTVRCVRACIPPGRLFGLYEHQNQGGASWELVGTGAIDEYSLNPSSSLYDGVTSVDIW
jgi:Concanavalin A-like lectin/glucanases superfamily